MNAIEAMKDSKIKRLQLSTATHGDDGIVVCVRDSGSGIDPNANVFEPFVSTKAQGLGMGLSIAKRIVEAHNGSIRIESDGAGTTVSMTFPSGVA